MSQAALFTYASAGVRVVLGKEKQGTKPRMRPQQQIYVSAVTDGTWLAAYNHRPGDNFVCAPPKCGTTWMQTIVASLLWPDGNFPGAVMEMGTGSRP